jgi:hypothetical protein
MTLFHLDSISPGMVSLPLDMLYFQNMHVRQGKLLGNDESARASQNYMNVTPYCPGVQVKLLGPLSYLPLTGKTCKYTNKFTEPGRK